MQGIENQNNNTIVSGIISKQWGKIYLPARETPTLLSTLNPTNCVS